jgi:hypothetical protein
VIEERTNTAMARLLTAPVDLDVVASCLAAVDQEVNGGVTLDGDLLLLRNGFSKPPDANLDAFMTERWVNDLHLQAPDVENWRTIVAMAAHHAGLALLEQARQVVPHRTIQVDFYVQPDAEPDEDQYFVGGLHLYQVRIPERDDLSLRLEKSIQPSATLTWIPERD